LHDRGINPYDARALEQIELPDSLHTLVLSRIDQLSDSQQVTLKVASVIGRLFRFAWLHGYYPALGANEAVMADLAATTHLDLTALDASEPELTYLFKHIVTREVAYESLSYTTRAQLHEQLARYRKPIPDTPPLGALIHHYTQRECAQTRSVRQAGDAAGNFANDAARLYARCRCWRTRASSASCNSRSAPFTNSPGIGPQPRAAIARR
jgi:hypothetical protein